MVSKFPHRNKASFLIILQIIGEIPDYLCVCNFEECLIICLCPIMHHERYLNDNDGITLSVYMYFSPHTCVFFLLFMVCNTSPAQLAGKASSQDSQLKSSLSSEKLFDGFLCYYLFILLILFSLPRGLIVVSITAVFYILRVENSVVKL